MPTPITGLKVFIASPGGLRVEREAFRDEIRAYNESEGLPTGVQFLPVGWEETLGRVGRPQAIINEDVRDADYFILLLCDRWGSPPDVDSSRFSSGTEEEYDVAMECYKDDDSPMRQLVLIFKAVSEKQLADPGPQLEKVLEFRKTIEREKSHLFHSFDTTESFKGLLRRHLAEWRRGEESGVTAAIVPPPDTGPGIEEDTVTMPTRLSVASSVRSMLESAWALADKGLLTEAEIEFSRLIVGKPQPELSIEFGRFLTRIGRLNQAIAMFEEAAKVAEDQKDTATVSHAYRNLGNVLRTRGDLDGAEQMYRKSLEIDEKLGRLEGMASAYGNLGVVLRTRGDLDGAEQMHRKALEIDEKLGRLEGMASAYGNLGNALRTRGDLDGAERMYRKSLEIAEKLGRLEGMASAYGSLGVVLRTRRDFDGAEQMHRKALEIDEKLGRLEGMASDYGNLGNALRTRGDLDGAEQMYRKSLEIDEKLGRLEGMASLMSDN